MRRKPVPNPLSEDQQKVFAKYVGKWQAILGMTDWRIERSRKPTRNAADVTMFYTHRLASYRIGDFGASEITEESIEATAVHELLHVLLYEIVNQSDHGITGDQLASAEHRVINALEKALMKDRSA